MAALTWREVSAPQLSTRDLALAGQAMTQGFDRLGQALANREESLMKKATDQAIAARLVQQDPNAMGQLDLTGLDRRVDLRALVEADNDHRAQLVERQRANEELLNSQSDSQFGTVIAGLADAALAGDANAEATLKAGRENDPMFARALARHYEKITGFRDTGADNRREDGKAAEEVRNNNLTDARGRAEIALRTREVSTRERIQRESDEGFLLGQTLARDYRLFDIDSARAKLQDNDRFLKLTPTQQRGVLESFDRAHAALTAETTGTRGGLPDPSAHLRALEAEGNRAENQARDPTLAALRRTGELAGKVDMPSLVRDIDGRSGWLSSERAVRDMVEKIRADTVRTDPVTGKVLPGARIEDFKAVIDEHDYNPGFWARLPIPSDIPGIGFQAEADVLRDRVQRLVDQRNKGYTANAELDVETARAPSANTATQIKQTRDELNRYLRAQERGQLSNDQLEEMKRVKQRLTELLDPRAR